jgi:hypothetical protein
MLSILPLIILLTPLSYALGTAILTNACPYPIYLFSVSQSYSTPAIPIAPGTTYTEPLRSSCSGCGTSLKISLSDHLLPGAQTQFEYSISATNELWYDISFVDCARGEDARSSPGHELGVSMQGANGKCGIARCAAREYCPGAAYYVSDPMGMLGLPAPVFTCPGVGIEGDLLMTICG